MAVIDGPGGPIADRDDDAFARIAAYSPEAAWNVLQVMSAKLREQDLAMVVDQWSDGLGDQLLD
jgi:hypothetical protein